MSILHIVVHICVRIDRWYIMHPTQSLDVRGGSRRKELAAHSTTDMAANTAATTTKRLSSTLRTYSWPRMSMHPINAGTMSAYWNQVPFVYPDPHETPPLPTAQ